ncbi:FTR1 family protein [Acinetobacter sp. B10A]|uniref:FTR1 family iron permease n=1 Tax=Acinetobacter baretiae TaxID=2605383 RepID=UPI001B3C6545|nr:FTR1 family protein [Acinetobacter baretiae]MBF7684448.1 FTR1 family protein [Acinetobacter baretiae]
MFATLLIVFREAFEAGLVISVILSACKGINIRWQVITGITLGLIFACLLAVFTNSIENLLSGRGLEVFNACLLSLTAVMLVWQITWMSTHGKALAQKSSNQAIDVIKNKTNRFSIAVIVMVAVMREGSEVVMFLYSIMVSTGTGIHSIIVGGILGILLGVMVSWITYKGLVLISIRKIFLYSNILLSLIAAGLVSQAIGLLASIDLLPALGYNIWDTSRFLSDNGWLGNVMRAIFGYTSTPMGIQLLSWVVTILVIITLTQIFKRVAHAN